MGCTDGDIQTNFTKMFIHREWSQCGVSNKLILNHMLNPLMVSSVPRLDFYTGGVSRFTRHGSTLDQQI